MAAQFRDNEGHKKVEDYGKESQHWYQTATPGRSGTGAQYDESKNLAERTTRIKQSPILLHAVG